MKRILTLALSIQTLENWDYTHTTTELAQSSYYISVTKKKTHNINELITPQFETGAS